MKKKPGVPKTKWISWSGIMGGPAVAPSGDVAGVLILHDQEGSFAVAGFAFPKAAVERPHATLESFFDTHSHAIVAEHVRSLPEAKRLAEAWLGKYRRGLVLAPCACEAMTTAPARPVTGRPPATRPAVASRSSATRRASSRSDGSGTRRATSTSDASRSRRSRKAA